MLHADVRNILSKHVDNEPQLLEKLSKFRAKLKEGRLVKEWNDINELTSNAIISLTTSFDQMPQTGWRRNYGVASEIINARIERYRDEVDILRRRSHDLNNRIRTYEELDTAEVDIRWKSAHATEWRAVPSDEIIREFAAPLKKGFSYELALTKIQSLVRHKFDSDVKEILEESLENVLLFFEVFEIAIRDEDGLTRIVKSRLPMLKGAFKSRTNMKGGKIDDEIPF